MFDPKVRPFLLRHEKHMFNYRNLFWWTEHEVSTCWDSSSFQGCIDVIGWRWHICHSCIVAPWQLLFCVISSSCCWNLYRWMNEKHGIYFQISCLQMKIRCTTFWEVCSLTKVILNVWHIHLKAYLTVISFVCKSELEEQNRPQNLFCQWHVLSQIAPPTKLIEKHVMS